MLMPNNARHVKLHRGNQPIFARYDVESQLDKMLQPQVTMKSGGYLVINQTEALVAIDINSGRSTKEHSIEDTALQTNLEAADEIARQLRLRDLAGLIVIDFIDMEENRNNRAVEKRLKEALKTDRARIQVGRISHFGLLEMSRQRMRASVLDSTTLVCPTCEGAGHVRSPSSIALHVLRSIEQHLTNSARNNITVKCSPETALFMLNQKRESLTDFEARFGVTISIEIDNSITTDYLEIIRGEPAQRRVAAPEHVQLDSVTHEGVDENEADEAQGTGDNGEDNDNDGNRRKRRRRRRGNNRNRDNQNQELDTQSQNSQTSDKSEEPSEQSEVTADIETSDEDKPKRRRRGKRGGRKHKSAAEENTTETVAQTSEAPQSEESSESPATDKTETSTEAEKPARRKRRTKEEIEADKAAKETEKEAKKAAKEAEREAKKAAKEAEKEAKKAEKAAEREAAKAAKAAEKAAAKEAEKEAKASKTRRSKSSSEAAEIVVTSEATEETDKKPARAGWWRRKG
jgi:ribonuclease E